MTIKCPACQSESPADSKFCRECGAPLNTSKHASITKTFQTPLKKIHKETIIAGKYKILEKIGEGGMGEVYKAKDSRLDRTVALKFLPSDLTKDPEAKKRFIQEARAAAALDHSNICTVYEVDETDDQSFIAMSYIPGQNLKNKLKEGPLDIDEAKDIALQVAEGLKEAHEKGIVHRDIKPANIMLTEKGQAKIMDFGLAKLSWGVDLTKTSTVMGTAAYMSPEQARGEKVDHRTDIWSLAAMFYEMLSGKAPFQKDQEQALIFSILNDKPAPLSLIRSDVPAHIENVIEKAMSKKTAQRYQNVSDLIQALKTSQADSLPKAEKSIVVLPFDDMSPDKDNEYFSDGLTEEIISDLSKIQSLRVISRTSAMMLKDTKKSMKTIGRELDVQYVLEGSVRKAGNKLRITAQLINASSDTHLWADKYNGTLDDVFDIQEKVSSAIADKIKLKLTYEEKERISEHRIENIKAYEYYLRARREIYKLTKEGLDNALKYLQKGLAIVGENVLLYESMGHVYYQYWNYGVWPDISNLKKAEQYAKKVFDLEPDSVHGHFLLGMLNIFIDPPQALVHFKRVLSEDPYHPETLLWLSLYVVFQGKEKNAKSLLERLSRVDPLNPIVKILPGNLHLHCGRFDPALKTLKKVYDSDPEHFVAQFHYARVLAYVNRFEEASSIIDHILSRMPEDMRARIFEIYKYAYEGKKSKVKQSMSQEFSAWAQRDWMACLWLSEVFSLIQENQKALDWLSRAVDQGMINYSFLNEYNPLFDNIRDENRFRKLMERVKHEWENFKV